MNLDDVVWDDTCPQCGRKIEKTLAWIKANPRVDVTCDCGFVFHLNASELSKALADLGKVIDEPIE